MSFKRKFNTPTKMAAPDSDDDDDVTRRSYDSRPTSENWATNMAGGSDVNATPFPNSFADTATDQLLDFQSRYGLSARKPHSSPLADRERKPEVKRQQPEVNNGEDDVMGSIQSVIGCASTLDEKQRVLTVMISQLQSLKQNLFQQKSNGVSLQCNFSLRTLIL